MKESVELRTKIPLKWIGGIPYCAILLLICLFAWNRPLYNPDILPYMAVVISYDHSDTAFSANTLHDKALAAAKKQLPADTYKQLTQGDAYKYQNGNEFSQQLPFYVVKPLYTWLTWSFYKSGLSLAQSTLVLSVISYFLIGLLLIIWISKYLPYLYAFLISLLVMISSPLLEMARLSSPDGPLCLPDIICTVLYSREAKVCLGFLLIIDSCFYTVR